MHRKPLIRLCSESVHIHNKKVPYQYQYCMDEWHQPAVARVIVTRELDKLKVQGSPVRGASRGRGRGGHRTRGRVYGILIL